MPRMPSISFVIALRDREKNVLSWHRKNRTDADADAKLVGKDFGVEAEKRGSSSTCDVMLLLSQAKRDASNLIWHRCIIVVVVVDVVVVVVVVAVVDVIPTKIGSRWRSLTRRRFGF